MTPDFAADLAVPVAVRIAALSAVLIVEFRAVPAAESAKGFSVAADCLLEPAWEYSAEVMAFVVRPKFGVVLNI